MGEGKGEGKRQISGGGAHIGEGGEGSEGKKREYRVVYTRANRGVCRLPQSKTKLPQRKIKLSLR